MLLGRNCGMVRGFKSIPRQIRLRGCVFRNLQQAGKIKFSVYCLYFAAVPPEKFYNVLPAITLCPARGHGCSTS